MVIMCIITFDRWTRRKRRLLLSKIRLYDWHLDQTARRESMVLRFVLLFQDLDFVRTMHRASVLSLYSML